jgi:splicing factor 3A subunit 3
LIPKCSARKSEVELLSVPLQIENGSDLDEFYHRLKKIQEHHARYPNQEVNAFKIELDALMEDVEDVDNEEFEQDDRQSSFSLSMPFLK